MKKSKTSNSINSQHYSVPNVVQRAFVYTMIGSFVISNAYVVYSLLSEDGIDSLSTLGYFSVGLAVPILFIVISYMLSHKKSAGWRRIFEATLYATMGFAVWSTLSSSLNYVLLLSPSISSTEPYYYGLTAFIIVGYAMAVAAFDKRRA